MRNYQSKMAIISGLALVALILGFAGMAVSAVRSDAEYMIAAADAKADAATAQADKLQKQVDTQTSQIEALSVLNTMPAGMAAQSLGSYLCTAYCTERYPHICGNGSGITASGAPVTADLTVAVDPDVIPLGSVLYIEGVGVRIAQDTGGSVDTHQIDVAVPGTHADALQWTGYGYHQVWLLTGGGK